MEFKQNEELIVVYFGELWLKGKNRNGYIRQLERNIRERLGGEAFELNREYDRLIIRLGKGAKAAPMVSRLKKVFGISKIEIRRYGEAATCEA